MKYLFAIFLFVNFATFAAAKEYPVEKDIMAGILYFDKDVSRQKVAAIADAIAQSDANFTSVYVAETRKNENSIYFKYRKNAKVDNTAAISTIVDGFAKIEGSHYQGHGISGDVIVLR